MSILTWSWSGGRPVVRGSRGHEVLSWEMYRGRTLNGVGCPAGQAPARAPLTVWAWGESRSARGGGCGHSWLPKPRRSEGTWPRLAAGSLCPPSPVPWTVAGPSLGCTSAWGCHPLCTGPHRACGQDAVLAILVPARPAIIPQALGVVYRPYEFTGQTWPCLHGPRSRIGQGDTQAPRRGPLGRGPPDSVSGSQSRRQGAVWAAA